MNFHLRAPARATLLATVLVLAIALLVVFLRHRSPEMSSTGNVLFGEWEVEYAEGPVPQMPGVASLEKGAIIKLGGYGDVEVRSGGLHSVGRFQEDDFVGVIDFDVYQVAPEDASRLPPPSATSKRIAALAKFPLAYHLHATIQKYPNNRFELLSVNNQIPLVFTIKRL